MNKADITVEAIAALGDPRKGDMLAKSLVYALNLPCSGSADGGVLPEASVCLRVIKGIVYPARFLALHGAVHHERGSGDKISEFKDV